jgi:Xaa-Pro aminopeptidase
MRTPDAEFESRWQRALAQSAARGLDGLIAVSRGASCIDSYADVFYLSGHYGNIGFTPDFQDYWIGRSHSAVLLAPGREPLLVVDGADYRRDLVGIAEVRFELDFPGAVARGLRDLGLTRGRVGVCGLNVMSARVLHLLEGYLAGGRTGGRESEEGAIGKHPGGGESREGATGKHPGGGESGEGATGKHPGASGVVELVDADDLIEGLRVIKSPFELERIRAAAEVGDAVVTAMMERACAGGATEAQAVAAGYAVGIAAGVHFFDTSIASGPYSNYFTYNHLPSWSQRVLQPGEIFHADSYGAVEGYLFDFGRTCIVGAEHGSWRTSDEQAALCQGAIDAVQAGIATIRPGVPASAVFDAVHGHLLSAGLAVGEGEEMDMENASALSIGFPPHGHGFGLGWEWPWILPTEERALAPGMCLAVEAMPTRAGLGSSYFEQDVVVTDSGCKLLTGARLQWW